MVSYGSRFLLFAMLMVQSAQVMSAKLRLSDSTKKFITKAVLINGVASMLLKSALDAPSIESVISLSSSSLYPVLVLSNLIVLPVAFIHSLRNNPGFWNAEKNREFLFVQSVFASSSALGALGLGYTLLCT